MNVLLLLSSSAHVVNSLRGIIVSSRDTVWTHVFEEYDGSDLCPLILCQVETQFSVGIISSMVSTALVSSWHKVRYCHLDQVG
jgi:hypothetical protein